MLRDIFVFSDNKKTKTRNNLLMTVQGVIRVSEKNKQKK